MVFGPLPRTVEWMEMPSTEAAQAGRERERARTGRMGRMERIISSGGARAAGAGNTAGIIFLSPTYEYDYRLTPAFCPARQASRGGGLSRSAIEGEESRFGSKDFRRGCDQEPAAGGQPDGFAQDRRGVRVAAR